MIICIDIDRVTKELMDSFVERGDYRDYSELVESALMNLSVLRSHVAKGKAIILDAPKRTDQARAKPRSQPEGASVVESATPELFRLKTGPAPTLLPDVSRANGTTRRYPPNEWLFGQYNKLLPVKATCRAVRSLLVEFPEGVELGIATATITDAAVSFRNVLAQMDAERASARGESIAAGFPSAKEKGRLRFSNQFIGAVTSADELAGFPADLKLLTLVSKGRRPSLTLTQAGWEFARLENPVLDRNEPAGRLTDDEAAYLLHHVETFIPQERAAYATILRAIVNGSATPDDLDTALRELVGDENALTPSHLATQRAGAIARMFDLNLIGREKSGLFVRYFMKDAGSSFLERTSE